MSNRSLALYLTDVKAGHKYQLSIEKPGSAGSLDQEVNFADRTTTNNDDYYPSPIVGVKSNLSNGFSFISEPFAEQFENQWRVFGRDQSRHQQERRGHRHRLV